MQEDQGEPRPPPRLAELRRRIRERSEEPSPDELWLASTLRLARLQRSPVELWAAMGREADYILVPGTYCSCPHFRYRVAPGETVEPCYHLVALEIARRTGRFHDLSETLSPEEVEAVVAEVLAHGRSPLLRRLLHRGMRAQP
ncbi:MAG: metal-binding protein [Crenarchaeota archaeon]|nr:metal-binding protein [Thermoproteota archaeon]